MKTPILASAILSLGLIHELPAQNVISAPLPAAAVTSAPTSEDPAEVSKESVSDSPRTEQEILSNENKLEAERLTHSTNSMRAEIARLKLERELIHEKAAYEAAKRQAERQEEVTRLEAEKLKISQESELSKLRADKLANDLKTIQTEAALEITRLQNDITRIETAERRARFADSKPVYLKNPLKENGTVVISDRRIPLNGLITPDTADFVTSRIQYWNNKDRELPIFIVIDASPGGSVMAGYRILKSMESSDAPVHVVVKSFAASMAAAITTLAEESYAYPNAVILHHQISSTIMRQLNLTEQREFHEESQRWWVRLGTPIADKMGITTDELIKRMYARSSSGDWSEFAEQAKELKWVNHIVQGIDETSVTKDPDSAEATARPAQATALSEQVDADGQPYAWLPRLNPKDVYFLYNPDKYYRMR
jgi:ATP-dependent Clp protease, protease subunit